MKLADFKNEMAMQKIAELNVITHQYGWKNINVNIESSLVSYAKMVDGGAVRMDVYYTTMTISISMNHPRKGKTQLHRRNVTTKELEELLQNPRTHTGKGYYTKYDKDIISRKEAKNLK